MDNPKTSFWFRKSRWLPLVIVLFVIAEKAKSQTHTYEAFIRGHKVGEMKVVREVNDESEKISVNTHIVAYMLVKIEVDFESHSSYMNGSLKEAEAISKTNGKVHSKATTYFDDKEYIVTIDQDRPVKLSESTLHGGDLFYFEEPKGMHQVYALATGKLLTVENDGNGTYYFINDGKKELHQYQNGQLQELRIEHRLYTVIFKRVN